MSQEIVQIDAFTDRPFAGNPAAICRLREPADEAWMQSVAVEMNLSETAFLHPEGEAFRLRWFTPGGEVELCGHATLAAAHYLWESGELERSRTALFDTRSGRLSARSLGDWIELDFPVDPYTEIDTPEAFPRAFGIAPTFSARTGLYGLFEVESESVLRALEPDPYAVRELHPGRRRGHGPGERAGARLRLALLRSGGRDRRGSGDRLGPLLAHAVLGRAARQARDGRLPGLTARWPGEGQLARRPCRPRGAGGHRPTRRAAGRRELATAANRHSVRSTP